MLHLETYPIITKVLFYLTLFAILVMFSVGVLVVVSLLFLAPLSIVGVIISIVLLYLIITYPFGFRGFPFGFFGLSFPGIPAVPFSLWEYPNTLLGVNKRNTQRELSFSGFATQYSIGGDQSSAYLLLGLNLAPGSESPNQITSQKLEDPTQFSMGWTTFGSDNERGSIVNETGESYLDSWARTLDDPEFATISFWPLIARFGVSYNLLILKKLVTQEERDEVKELWGSDWPGDMGSDDDWDHLDDDRFLIETKIFEKFRPQQTSGGTTPGATRFTPATIILLKRNSPVSRDIIPYAIQVSGFEGADRTTYESGDGAWLYAIQAAKASITTWGIWVGHVFHWHMVTAAMQMTMIQTMRVQHPVRQVLGRQSDHLIGFNQFLLLHWEVGPPTSFTDPLQFLELMQEFSTTRNFSDDDPKNRLAEQLNLIESDFTSTNPDAEPWEEYKTAQYIINVWDATENYVRLAVDAIYVSDDEITQDNELQAWISDSRSQSGGNVRGLPNVNNREDLVNVLTSLLHRITVHGLGRLNQTSNPALSFAGNFPPCLQRSDIPSRNTPFTFHDPDNSSRSISAFLPLTGTIGDYVKFLYFFTYSTPYNSFIPIEGIDEQPEHPFSGGTAAPLTSALIAYRRAIEDIMQKYADDANIPGPPAQLHQWELNIEN